MDILQMSSKEYDTRLWKTYWVWCDKRAINSSHFQALLANSAINRWFMREYDTLQRNFLEFVDLWPGKLRQPEYHYAGFMTEIYMIYPKPLIDAERGKTKNLIIELKHKLPLIYAN